MSEGNVAATFSISGITDSSATVTVTLGTGYTHFRVFARYYDDAGSVVFDDFRTASGPFSVVITGLSPSTHYIVNVRSGFSHEDGVWAGGQDFWTDAYIPPRPDYFSWTAGETAAKPGGNALRSGDPFPAFLTAAGWNTYTANINRLRSYKGLGAASFTAATAGVTELSAAMVKEAINAIDAMTPPVSPPAVNSIVSGQTAISAALLNALVDSLNSIL